MPTPRTSGVVYQLRRQPRRAAPVGPHRLCRQQVCADRQPGGQEPDQRAAHNVRPVAGQQRAERTGEAGGQVADDEAGAAAGTVGEPAGGAVLEGGAP
jgi:hypothetical protein